MVFALVGMLALLAAACGGDDVSQDDLDAANASLSSSQAQVSQLQAQIAATGPVNIVQVGELAAAAPAQAAPSGWDTDESVRGGLILFAKYDSSGPDAWDVAAHSMVYVTGQGGEDLSERGIARPFPGFQIADAYSKEVITTAGFDLGTELQAFPHGIGISPDGKWIYVPTGIDSDSGNAARDGKSRLLVVNARTLKLDKVLTHLTGGVHHVVAFKDWEDRDRIRIGSNVGSTFVLDPNDDQRVVMAVTPSDMPGGLRENRIGHPYLTVDPTGRYLYQQLRPQWLFGSIIDPNCRTLRDLGIPTSIHYSGELWRLAPSTSMLEAKPIAANTTKMRE